MKSSTIITKLKIESADVSIVNNLTVNSEKKFLEYLEYIHIYSMFS